VPSFVRVVIGKALPPVRVSTDDATYTDMLAGEATMWADPFLDFEHSEAMVPAQMQVVLNEALTGRSDTHWLDELVARGPFAAAATLGATSGYLEQQWLERRASAVLDVYELSKGVIRKTRDKLAAADLLDGVRFIEADLNLTELPERQYDLIWSAGALHHLVSLEFVCEQVHRALKPGGIFAFYEYVGEPRVQFDALRIKLSQEALAGVPDRFFRGAREVRSPDVSMISPFEAIRSDEIKTIVSARFETIRWSQAAVLVPLGYTVDLPAIGVEMPELLDRLMDAERASASSGLDGCVCYGVFRRP
jgi:SAM-dependent methyltransferase